MYHTPSGNGFFLPWLTFHLWAEKIRFFFSFKGLFGKEKWGFWVMFDVSSPRRRCGSSHGRLVLNLGEVKAHLGEVKARLGEGVRLGMGGTPR